MAEQRIDQIRQTSLDGTVQRTTQVVDDPGIQRDTRSENTAARVVMFITGTLLTLLAFRFVLAALGANPSNGFANFIYSASHPFVAPFFSLFGYNLHYGVSRIETFTLVAMAVYALVGYGIARLVSINRR